MEDLKISGDLNIYFPAIIEDIPMAEQTIEGKAMDSATAGAASNLNAQNNIMFYEKSQTELQLRMHKDDLQALQLNHQSNLNAQTISHQASLNAVEISKSQSLAAQEIQFQASQNSLLLTEQYGILTIIP